MKLLLVTICLVVAVNAFDKEKYILKKWAMHKAFEGCLGENMMKKYMVQKKQAVAKCMQLDAPELQLSIFKYPYRTVGALAHAGMPTPNKYNLKNRDDDDDEPNGAILKYFIERAVRDIMNEEDDDDEDEAEDMDVLRRFFKRRPSNRYRFKRESKKEVFEIGERLNNKLQQLKTKITQEIGNYTCVLKECGTLNDDGMLNDVNEIVNMMNENEFPDPWLQENIESDVRICHKVAQAVPEEILDECMFGRELKKVKIFKKCLKMRKLKTCMNFDIKQQLEENFAPLKELVEQTQMEEKSLLPLVYKLLHGDQDKMM